eukprot:9622326-Heterocapsa_arctica.AAC.1
MQEGGAHVSQHHWPPAPQGLVQEYARADVSGRGRVRVLDRAVVDLLSYQSRLHSALVTISPPTRPLLDSLPPARRPSRRTPSGC